MEPMGSGVHSPDHRLPAAEANLRQMVDDIQRLVEVKTASEDQAAVAAGAAETAALAAGR